MKLTKTLLLAPLVAGALITSCFAAADSQDDISYSVGYTMGQTLKTKWIKVIFLLIIKKWLTV